MCVIVTLIMCVYINWSRVVDVISKFTQCFLTSLYKVNNCPNTKRRNKDKTFFRFPPDKRFGWKWIKASHNMELARLGPQACCEDPAIAMCQDHFDYRCFCSDSKVKLRLAIDSVPTVNLDLPSRLKTKRKRYDTGGALPPPFSSFS